VPYADLNLARDADASELDRRIHVAARLVCTELDIKYPPSQYPTIAGDDCEQVATRDGLTQADQIIAAAKK
jgi:UrcA family protein